MLLDESKDGDLVKGWKGDEYGSLEITKEWNHKIGRHSCLSSIYNES
jgi:hypothetical protein